MKNIEDYIILVINDLETFSDCDRCYYNNKKNPFLNCYKNDPKCGVFSYYKLDVKKFRKAKLDKINSL